MSKKFYELYYCEFRSGKAIPTKKIGEKTWEPMTHQEAITARSKFSQPNKIILVEVEATQE